MSKSFVCKGGRDGKILVKLAAEVYIAMPICSTCGIGSGEVVGQCHTCVRSMSLDIARQCACQDSRTGYVQHVNRSRVGYIVSDWFDNSTVASFENGREL